MSMIIRKIRLEKGLSQAQLAEMSGVSIRTIQRLERGAAASAETLKCIAAVLEVEFTLLRKDHAMPAENQATTLPAEEREAMEYVRDLQGFYVHLIQYVVIMLALAALNLWLSPGFLWVVFPALGWGLGVLFHGLSVFEVINLFGRDWERRQIARRLRR
ncbi:MAG: 2TM domain-containing protein [Pararhodobacter sp.]